MKFEKYLVENAKKDAEGYKADPLYKAVLTAKSKAEQEKAFKALEKIRGRTAVGIFLKKVKENPELYRM